MNQKQIENLSTEEYSYFLGHGDLNDGTNSPQFASLSSLLQTFELDEAPDCDHEDGMPQRFKDVRGVTSYDDE